MMTSYAVNDAFLLRLILLDTAASAVLQINSRLVSGPYA